MQGTTDLTRLVAIVGSAKSGTTALAHHLNTHPETVLGTEKEPRFFTDFHGKTWSGPGSRGFAGSLISDRQDYIANFEGLREGQWAIDASTDYIWCEATPDLLAAFTRNCDLRIICVVRDPVDRAVSEYNHTLRDGWEPLSFSASLDAERQRIRENWQPLFYHQRRSTVCADVTRFVDVFGDRVLIVDYQELRNPENLMGKLCDFLGVDRILPRKIEKRNRSYLPRNKYMKSIMQNEAAKRAARLILSAPMRKKIWRLMHAEARAVKTVYPHELAKLKELLGNEIESCKKSPLIPTQNWTCL